MHMKTLARRINQPEPAPRKQDPEDKADSVQSTLINYLKDRGCSVLAAVAEDRRAMGIEKYGAEVYMHNGRNPLIDAAQENMDNLVYLVQARLEGSIPAVVVDDAIDLAEKIMTYARLSLQQASPEQKSAIGEGCRAKI